MTKIDIINKIRENNMDNVKEEALVEKKPSIKLVQKYSLSAAANVYSVRTMKDTIRYAIGQELTKAQVVELIDTGTITVTIS